MGLNRRSPIVNMTWNLDTEIQPFEGGEFCWYAIETRHHCEKKVVDQLSRIGIETFLPQRQEMHHWSDRRKHISIPLFSRYAFVRLDPSRQTRRRVLVTAGVVGLVSSMGQALPVPSQQVEHLRRLLQLKVPCSLHPFLRTGQRVRIRGGCLNGIEGVLTQSDKHMVISVDCLQHSLAVQIEGYELELV